MVLVLTNGEKITVTRLNCGHQYFGYKDSGYSWIREWNIDPAKILVEPKRYRHESLFVIGKWGTTAEAPAERLIPISRVMYIEDTAKW